MESKLKKNKIIIVLNQREMEQILASSDNQDLPQIFIQIIKEIKYQKYLKENPLTKE